MLTSVAAVTFFVRMQALQPCAGAAEPPDSVWHCSQMCAETLEHSAGLLTVPETQPDPASADKTSSRSGVYAAYVTKQQHWCLHSMHCCMQLQLALPRVE
jgi:hypothetical protein